MNKIAPISLCMIVKDEANQLEDCLKSIRPYVQEICIIDTGSKDNTPEIAKKYADKFEIYTEANNPETGLIEDFAKARNKSYELASDGISWVAWKDGDDLIKNPEAFIDITEKFKDVNQNVMILLPYEYSHDASGNPTMIHYRERLVKIANGKNVLDKFRWCSPVHETLNPAPGAENLLTIQLDSPIYIHNRSKKVVSEPSRNLRILKKWFEKHPELEDGSDCRQLYYIALEYSNNNDLHSANKYLAKYVKLSGWEDECCLAYLKMSENYLNLGEFDKSIEAAMGAMSVMDHWGEPYFALCRAYYFKALKGGVQERRNWEKCINFGKMGLEKKPTQTVLFVNPLERKVDIYKYLNFAQNKVGDVEGALQSVETALKSYPEDPHFKNNQMFYIKHLSRLKINDELGKMRSVGAVSQNCYDSIMKCFDADNATPQLPSATNDSKSEEIWKIVAESKEKLNDCYWDGDIIVKKSVEKKIIDGKKPLDIIFYVGNGLRPCNPKLPIKAGGSEKIEEEISGRLTKYGHRVRLYNNPGETEGLYNGVEYIKTEKFHDLECDVAIISRFANMLDDNYNIKAKLKLLHCHDLVAINGSNKNLLNADRILALSNFHKQYLISMHNLHESHLVKTRNGIDINLFKNRNIKRDPYKLIGASSPDRYLASFLDMYPIIKQREPRTSAVICYGMDNWRQIAQANNDINQLETIKMLENKMKELEPLGLNFKGKLTQEELIDEMLSSSVGILSNWFLETSCLIAQQNCAAGVKMISSKNGALPETNVNGILIDGDWMSDQYKNDFIDAICNSFNTSEEERQRMMQYAIDNFDIDKLVDDWNEMFYRLIDEKQSNPIISYQKIK